MLYRLLLGPMCDRATILGYNVLYTKQPEYLLVCNTVHTNLLVFYSLRSNGHQQCFL